MLAQAVRFSTHALDEAHRSSRWEEWNRAALIGLDCRTPHGLGLRGEETTLDLPDVTLGHVRAEPHRVRRTGETVEAGPADSVVVYAFLRGRSTFSDGSGSHLLTAGDVAVVDADRPFTRTFPTPFAELALKFPRRSFDGARPAGPGFVRPSGLAAVRVRALERHLAEPVRPIDAGHAGWLGTVARDLVTDLTTCDGPGDRLALGCLLVEQHLGDATLSASRLATTLGISVRQLSRLFADADTSFPRYLTDRRLLRAAALLTCSTEVPVGAVAASCGFSSAAYFGRVFRDHHGVSPGRFRSG